MTDRAERVTKRYRVAALLLIAGLAAGPLGTHVYWLLGGTWGLHRSVGGQIEQSTTAGIRVVAAVVVVLLVAALLVVLARVGLWHHALVPDRVVWFLAWVLTVVFLVEAVANFTWSREYEWWLYGPASLVIGLLALAIASSNAEVVPVRSKPRFSGKYLSLTSFKRDGSGVATPVWFVNDNGHLLVETDADSYKVRRIRRDPHVRIALCDARGHIHGELVEADATNLPEDERRRVERLLVRKYRIDRYTFYPLYRLFMRLRGRASRTQEPPVALEITPRG